MATIEDGLVRLISDMHDVSYGGDIDVTSCNIEEAFVDTVFITPFKFVILLLKK